jgi:hypothetical protein
MNRIQELGVGDIIRPQRRPDNFYRVIRLSDGPFVFLVQLKNIHTGKGIARTMHQITNNWLMVKPK